MSLSMLLWNTVVLTCAIIFFTKGFLLIRLEIGHKSRFCDADKESISTSLHEPKVRSCVASRTQHQYQRLVIIIIDALRYDFAFYQDDDLAKLPFHNNMPIFRDLMHNEGCEKARLWRFKADAPTTTMQRLKALMTGSLPTFIDVSENFASSKITEDNLIDQFLQAKMNITFMGDDTWMGLFPERFNKAFPYPSFDVKDLHLVDNGVIAHLLPEMAEDDWQILIAHFLGVDHVGHSYSPIHPEMPMKLRQMNEMLKGVVNAMDNDTLLLVMGDHGMTATGDHGGETFNEATAALFAYSPVGALASCHSSQQLEVDQVDIVPTISLLLGTPIPFANLGIVIKDMLPWTDEFADGNTDPTVLEALRKNLKQMHTYLKAYQEITKSLPRDQFESLNLKIEHLEEMVQSSEKLSVDHIEKAFRKIMRSARDMCRMVWAKFNVGLMVSGLCFLFYWLLTIYTTLTEQSSLFSQKSFAILSLILLCACIFIPNLMLVADGALGFLFSWVTAMLLLYAFTRHALMLKICLPQFSSVIAISIVVTFSVFFTANSYVLTEDTVALYLFSSAFLLSAYFNHPQLTSHFTDDKRKKEKDSVGVTKTKLKASPYFSHNTIKKCSYVFTALLCARLAFFFRSCRPEQFWCFDDDTASVDAINRDMLLWTALSSLSIPLCVWLTISNLQASKRACCFHDKIILMSTTFCVMHWMTLIIPKEVIEMLPSWVGAVFARCSYALMIVHLIFQWIDPTIGNIVVNERSKNIHELEPSQNAKLDSHEKNVTPSVNKNEFHPYFTTINFTLSRLILCLLVLFSLLLGPLQAMAIPLWMITVYCFFQVLCPQTKMMVGFDVVVTWNLLCSFWWFATGHQASLASIRWDAAFVGFQGNHVNNVIPASLLVLDTFSMQILSSVCLPVLLVRLKSDDTNLVHNAFDDALLDVYTKHFCYHVIKIIGCMAAALMHRRHLMVWWIFAPRFLFELISFIFILVSSIGSYAFVGRCNKRVQLYFVNQK